MPGSSPQGPLGSTPIAPIDAGTSALMPSPAGGSVGTTANTAGANNATAAATEATDPDIEALNLKGKARTGAYALKKAHPSVAFTSGRRDKSEQAHAMASNVTAPSKEKGKDNRKWIGDTYSPSKVSKACQKWVDDNPDKKTIDEVSEGLLSVLDAATDDELALLSKHLSGEAFDVQPVETDADAIKKTIRGLDGCKFLEKEGGLVRWHAQF